MRRWRLGLCRRSFLFASGLRPLACGRGRVCDGRLVCPFHGIEYDTSGHCLATPYADPPKYTRLRIFETQEVCGLVFGWWGMHGRGPIGVRPPTTWNRNNGAISRSGPRGFRATPRKLRKTPCIWPIFDTSMVTAALAGPYLSQSTDPVWRAASISPQRAGSPNS